MANKLLKELEKANATPVFNEAGERTWLIADIDGTNQRRVTLAGYRAELDAAKVRALAIAAHQRALMRRTT